MSAANAATSYDLLTEEQIIGCLRVGEEYGNFNAEFYNANVKPTLQNARKYISERKLNNKFKVENFKKVYVTSDIHSDYRKFVELLVNANIIEIPAGIDLYNDEIYSMDLITNTTWKSNNIALIILGDIVDGSRGEGYEVNDNEGYFEFFIHAFLYNLRIKALDKNSILAFTFGNHDFHSLIHLDDGMLNNYVASSSKYFFGKTQSDNDSWKIKRKNALLPFYEVHPMFFIGMYNEKNKPEVIGIHGGFHSPSGTLIGKEINAMQNQINELSASISLESLKDGSFYNSVSNMAGGLWTRFYEEPTACEQISKIPHQPLVIVGHCVTMSLGHKLQQITMKSNPHMYLGCDMGYGGRGCVVSSCDNKLVHVDVGMSGAFYMYKNKTQHKHRDAEMLVLTHDPLLSVETRYFNVVQRFSKTGGLIDVFTSPVGKRPRALALNGNTNIGIGGGKRSRKSARRLVTFKRKNKSRRLRR